jgi:SAM-dependent methyltransferase
MSKRKPSKPIALEAYETLAERYAALADTKAENAYCERPATLSLLGDVNGKRVLDAGCGPGFYCEWLLARGAEVVALDVSPKMVELAKRRLGPRVDVRLADLSEPLDFLADASFDLVLSPLVLDYIEDWSGALREFSRVLRPGGALVFSVEHPFMRLAPDGGGDYFATEYVETPWVGFGIRVVMPSYRRPLGAMTSALSGAGFLVERLVEAKPTEECRGKDRSSWERLTRLPGFLCIRAAKNS